MIAACYVRDFGINIVYAASCIRMPSGWAMVASLIILKELPKF